ncbi:MAG: hypothetical protein AAF236_15715 [Verrucomicrobiota bacterium]
MPRPVPDQYLLLCLRLGTFLCFLGWAWAHLYWEGPYHILVWNDQTFALARSLGISWETYVGTEPGGGIIQKWLSRVGWLYVLCAIVSLTVRKGRWVQLSIVIFGSGLLLLMAWAKYVGAQRQLPMLVEHGGQFLMPILLVLALQLGARHRATVIVALIAFVATFAGHGAYALGLWPTPPTFFGMTTVILDVEFDTARRILQVAGILDFLICVGIFIPALRVPSAIYGAAWGLLTALARPVAGMSSDLIYWGADQFLHEAVLRAPHVLIPIYLALLWGFRQKRKQPLPF